MWIYDAMQAWSRTKIHGIGSQDQYLRSTDMSATDVIQPEFLLQLLIQKSHRGMLAGMSRRGDTRLGAHTSDRGSDIKYRWNNRTEVPQTGPNVRFHIPI